MAGQKKSATQTGFSDATDGMLGGDGFRGSRVMLPVGKSIPGHLHWLVALPESLNEVN